VRLSGFRALINEKQPLKNGLGGVRPAIFSTNVFGQNDYNVMFLNILALSLNSGRASVFRMHPPACLLRSGLTLQDT
jgi:hypothetical protein